MTEHRASTQGEKLQLANETALGTVGSWTDIEFNDGLELPTQTRQTYKPPVGGRTNPADTTTVIEHENGTGTGKIAVMARRGTTTLTPTIGKLLKSGGWQESGATSLVTTAAGTVVGSIVLSGDNGVEDGYGMAVEQDDGSFEPCLVADWTVGTTTAIPLFDLEIEPSDGNDVQKMFTYCPQTGPVGSTATIGLRSLSRAEDGSSNPQQWTHTGVATTLQDTTISKDMPLELSFETLIAKTTLTDGTWSTETFNDRTELTLTDNKFQFLMLQADPSSGGLTNTQRNILDDATISWGVTTKPIPSFGGSNVNTVGGYSVDITAPPRITVSGVFEASKWADYETVATGGSGTNPETALQFNWIGADINHPTVMIAFPRCRLAEAPSAQTRDTESGLVQGTLVFEATGANLNSNEGPTEVADQAAYIAISGQLT